MDNRGHGTAMVMTEYEHERRFQMVDPVFHGSDLIDVENISGHLDDKEISYSLVKENLNGNPGIGAGNDRSERMLSFGSGQVAPLAILVGMHGMAGGKAIVSGLELRHGFIGSEHTLGRGGRCPQ